MIMISSDILSQPLLTFGNKATFDMLLLTFFWQLYMAPVTHPERYSHSIDFWRNVYGIDSKYYINFNFEAITKV